MDKFRGGNPLIEAAAKPEAAIDKGLAGTGLLTYMVTSKFSAYLPPCRLEDIVAPQGFEISRATQSVWSRGVADLALYEQMAERVRTSRVVATDGTIMPMLAKGKAANARMWVYAGADAGRQRLPSRGDHKDSSRGFCVIDRKPRRHSTPTYSIGSARCTKSGYWTNPTSAIARACDCRRVSSGADNPLKPLSEGERFRQAGIPGRFQPEKSSGLSR